MTPAEIARDVFAILGVIATLVRAYRLWHWNKKRIAQRPLEIRSAEHRRVQQEPPPPSDDDRAEFGVGASG